MSLSPNHQALSVFQRVGVGLLLATLSVSIWPAAAAAQDRKPLFPEIRLFGKVRGEQAIRALEAHLPTVAAHYGMTAEKLRNILRNDRNAVLDEQGRLLFIDEFPALDQAAPAPIGVAAATGSTDLTQTFLLHSKPGSKRVIYLDFDGQAIVNTAWNAGTILAVPYDLDGDPSTFSATEQQNIQYMWQRVAEDYAPFDVDVTTQQPPDDAIFRTSSTDQNYGTRVVITRAISALCSGCGGVAYVGTFDNYSSTNPGYYEPAWVFFDQLASNEKYIAEAAAHEAGHNLGLSHDGTSATGYYAGQGSGATGWAPIMGVGYYKEVTQWSKGEYPGANNTEDDLTIIPANGALLRTDDFGNSIATAASLGGVSGNGMMNVGQSGVIEQRTDKDYFSFVSGAGAVQLNVAPATRGANLDISATLIDGAGNTVAASNPVDALDASISANLAGGSYFLVVEGVGKGDLTTGYSDYASLGQYQVTGSYPQSGAMPPKATATATPSTGTAPLNVSFTGSGSSDSDGFITAYAWNFGDGGTSTTADSTHLYNSAGSYTASLTVTDNQGLKNTATLIITVNPSPATNSIHVGSIVLSESSPWRGSYQCAASITVRNNSGSPASGATVKGQWSGVVSAAASGVTNTSGVVSIKAPRTTKPHGTCTFTVNSVTLTSTTYDPAQNVETSDSLTY